jgi:hypothetical protein
MEMQPRRMSDDPDAPAIVEDTRRRQMSEEPDAPAPRRIGGKINLMPEEPAAPGRGGNRMQAVPKKRPSASRRKGELPEQIEPKGPRRVTARGEPGYLRIRVHAENDQLSVQEIRHVEGPLVAHEELHGDLAWEATLGGNRLSSGAIPDAGMMRSFPHPDPAPGQEGHAFTPATSYDFNVRVPKEAVSERTLPRLGITLYRIKEGPMPRTEGPQPLAARFEKELRPVGRIDGIRIEDLPRSAQAAARALFADRRGRRPRARRGH